MAKISPSPVAPDLDAAWIMTLWKAIHGGDPTPEQIALQAISALSSTLAGNAAPSSEATFAQFQTRLKEIGIDLRKPRAQERMETPIQRGYEVRCMQVPHVGQVCYYIPTVKAPPPQNPG
jgi:hypothetical protein